MSDTPRAALVDRLPASAARPRPRVEGPVARPHSADLQAQLFRLQGAIGNRAVGDLTRSGLFDRVGTTRPPVPAGPLEAAPRDPRVERSRSANDAETAPATADESPEPCARCAEDPAPAIPAQRKADPTVLREAACPDCGEERAPVATVRRLPAAAGVQRDWLDAAGDSVSNFAGGAVDQVTGIGGKVVDTVTGVAGGVVDQVSGAVGKGVDAVSNLASGAVDAVSGALDAVTSRLRAVFDATVGQLGRVWTTVRTGANAVVDGVLGEVGGLLGRFGAMFSSIGNALGDLDGNALRAAWAAITGTAASALATARSLAGRVTATIDGLFSGLQGLSTSLIGGMRSQAEALIGHLPGVVQGPARSLWQTIEAKATSAWQAIEAAWKPLRAAAVARIEKLVAKVASVAGGLKDSAMGTVIATIDQVKGFMAFVKQAMANPDGLIQPLVQEILRRLQGLPEKAKGEAQKNVQSQAGGAAVPSGPATASPVGRRLQRDAAAAGRPRSTLGVGQVLGGSWDFIVDKLGKLWANLGTTVKDMVLGVIDPRAIAKGLKQDWTDMTKDLSERARRIEKVRTDSWDGFSEDLRRYISNLIDFPMIIWRTANAMLGRLSVYIGLATILGGAILGAIAGGTGGAIFGTVVPVAGNAAGGAAGVAAGAWAGAQAGYALAETIGLVLLVSFASAEAISSQKAVNDLLWVPQDEAEQNEDFNQVSDSVIAVATALLLMGIAFVGVALAKRVWAFVKNLPKRFVAPKVVEPEPVPAKPVDPPITKTSKVIICRVCVELKSVPPEILERRAKLSPEMQAFLDEKLNRLVRDPLNPTPVEFERLTKIMDGIERANGGDLEAGLRADKARQQPAATKPPFGPEVAQLPRLRAAALELLADIDEFLAKNPDRESVKRARVRVVDDMDGVLSEMEAGRKEVTPARIEGFDNNVKGARNELKKFQSSPPGTQFGVKKSGREIDRIPPDGSRWINDKSTNLFGADDPRVADLSDQARKTMTVAQLPEHAVGGKAPIVEFHFGDGVTPEAAAKLRGVTVGDQTLVVTGDEIPLKR